MTYQQAFEIPRNSALANDCKRILCGTAASGFNKARRLIERRFLFTSKQVSRLMFGKRYSYEYPDFDGGSILLFSTSRHRCGCEYFSSGGPVSAERSDRF
jgi:hypothetical protein